MRSRWGKIDNSPEKGEKGNTGTGGPAREPRCATTVKRSYGLRILAGGRGNGGQERHQVFADGVQRLGARVKSSFRDDHIIASARDKGLSKAERLSYQPLQAVAPYGRTGFSGHRHTQAKGQFRLFSGPDKKHEAARKVTPAFTVATQKIRALRQSALAGKVQTANLFRPLARLRRRISRPAGLDMRARNP